jgi:hypothetical protein
VSDYMVENFRPLSPEMVEHIRETYATKPSIQTPREEAIANLCESVSVLRARLERAERAIGNALNALQDPNAEYLTRGIFCREAIEILRGWKAGKSG